MERGKKGDNHNQREGQMSCEECEKFQESGMTSYYRWKNANIEVKGCRKHLKEVFEALNKIQEELKNGRANG